MDSLVVHGFDDATESSIIAQLCVASAYGLAWECSAQFASYTEFVSSPGLGDAYQGDFSIEISESDITPSAPGRLSQIDMERGYGVLVMTLATNGDSRLTGYTMCAGVSECAAVLASE